MLLCVAIDALCSMNVFFRRSVQMEERAFALGVQFVLLRVFGKSSKLLHNVNEQMASAEVILS